MRDVKVYVIRRDGRKNFEAEWKCPHTGRTRRRSLKTNIRREADRLAGRLELELKDEAATGIQITWEDFRDRYEVEALTGLADNTAKKVSTVFNSIEKTIKPGLLTDLNEQVISRYVVSMRKAGRSEATIAGHLRHLKAGIQWAFDMKLIPSVPTIRMPKGSNKVGSKGRPITVEEFERIISKVPAIVGEDRAASWQHLLYGLWWSGLRLGEALKLHWTDETGFVVDRSGRFPMFRIAAEAEKGRKDRLLPMAPEFAQFLDRMETQRGYVFNPLRLRETTDRPGLEFVSRTIISFGESAAVKVADRGEKVVWASAHDLRRAFGFRWSQRLMPADLKDLMRHEQITTTEKFYLGQNAESRAANIWQAFSTIPSTTAFGAEIEKPANSCELRVYE